MQFSKRIRRRAPTVIIVSLIDVLLVVLIFLMVTTTFKKLEPALQLTLPESREAKLGSAEPNALTVVVSTNFPFFYFEGQPIAVNELLGRLESAASQDPRVRLDIRADKKAPLGEVLKIWDAAKQAEVGSINLITTKGE